MYIISIYMRELRKNETDEWTFHPRVTLPHYRNVSRVCWEGARRWCKTVIENSQVSWV